MTASFFLLTGHILCPDRQPGGKSQAKRHIVSFEAKKAVFSPSIPGDCQCPRGETRDLRALLQSAPPSGLERQLMYSKCICLRGHLFMNWEVSLKVRCIRARGRKKKVRIGAVCGGRSVATPQPSNEPPKFIQSRIPSKQTGLVTSMHTPTLSVSFF